MAALLNTRLVLRGVIPPLLSLAALAVLAWFTMPYLRDLNASLGAARIDPAWVVLGAALTGTHYAIAFIMWTRSLQLSGVSMRARQAANMWVPGLLARYIPGKIWSNALRLAVARRHGSPVMPVAGAMGWETLIAIATASAFGLITFRSWPDPAVRTSAIGVLLLSGGTLLVARLAVARHRLPRWLEKAGLLVPARNSGGVLQLVVLNFFGWVVYGAAHWALARAILPVSLENLSSIAGAVALAWAGGYLALVMPAGLGVREGVLVLLLAPSLGSGAVVLLATGSRLISIALDLGITAVWVWRRTPKSFRDSPPSS